MSVAARRAAIVRGATISGYGVALCSVIKQTARICVERRELRLDTLGQAGDDHRQTPGLDHRAIGD